MKKRIINMRAEFNLFSKLMSEKEFFNKFELSDKLVAEVTAEDAINNLYCTDRQMTAREIRKEFFNKKPEI